MTKNNYFERLKQLQQKSYCPYSKFRVATIIVTDIGEFEGVNVENISSPLTVCAERNAIFQAVTKGMKKVYELHLLTDAKDINESNMCGACRQVLQEWASKDCKVYVYDQNGKVKKYEFNKLFPHAFKLEAK